MRLLKDAQGFTLVEVVISMFVLGIALIGIFGAFKETFWVLHYINDSINGSYLAKNGMEEVVAVRNLCFSQYQSAGWSKFVEKYLTGTYILSPTRIQCDQSMSGITDKPSAYEGPLNAFGDITTDRAGVHYLRKIDIFPDSRAFYLQNISRTNTGTGDLLTFGFSQTVYSQSNMLVTVPLTLSGGSNTRIVSSYGELYNIDGVADGMFDTGNFSNLGQSDIKYSKILSYSGEISVPDGASIQVFDPDGWEYDFEFDSDGSIVNTGATVINSSGATMDMIQYELCKKINEIESLECRFNKIFPNDLIEKLLGTADSPSVDFGSGYILTLTGTQIQVLLGTNHTIPALGTNQFINPSYLTRSIGTNPTLSLKDDQSDMTAGKGILIPDKPGTLWSTNTNQWYPSLLNIKVSLFLYDGDNFVEENDLSMKLGDIQRYSYNAPYEN